MQQSFMEEALKQAKKAAKKDEVPVGAVIVRRGKIISRARNEREDKKDPLAHAELLAIKRAARKIGGWRLSDCTIYVTLEPCPMCAGAIANSRISEVVFGAYDKKGGAYGSLYNIADGRLNHTPNVQGGFMQKQCAEILKAYFATKRG